MENEKVCLCSSAYDIKRFMIECDFCEIWFHGTCVNVTEEQAMTISQYACPSCTRAGKTTKHGSSPLKPSNSTALPLPLPYRFDNLKLSELSAVVIGSDESNIYKDKASTEFRKSLQSGMFARSGIRKMKSGDFSAQELHKTGFQEPILLEESSHLAMRLPTPSIGLAELEQVVGAKQVVKSIKVSTQETKEMTREEWSKERVRAPSGLANMLFHIEGTQFDGRIQAPHALKELDWQYTVPFQQYQARIGVPPMIQPKNSRNIYGAYYSANVYRDFLIHSGGSSAWFHVLNGACELFLIPPTADNLIKYEQWLKSPVRGSLFFGDVVEKCIKCELSAGFTMVIPSGWIYSMFAPSTSICLIGLFQHSLNLPWLLSAYQMERRVSPITNRWSFIPQAEGMMWWVARHHVDSLTRSAGASIPLTQWEAAGLTELIRVLRSWMHENRTSSAVSKQIGKQKIPISHAIPAALGSPQDLLYRLQLALSKAKAVKADLSSIKSPLNDKRMPPAKCRCHAKKCPSCRNCVRRHCPCNGAQHYISSSAKKVPTPKSSSNSVSVSQMSSASSRTAADARSNATGTKAVTGKAASTIKNIKTEPENMVPEFEWPSEVFNTVDSMNSFWTDPMGNESSSVPISGLSEEPGPYDDLGLEMGELAFEDAFAMNLPTDDDLRDVLKGEENDHSNNNDESANAFLDSIQSSLWLDSTDENTTSDNNSKHRTTCHRCGNIRKRVVQCEKCPSIFCPKCAEMIKSTHGNQTFEGGCPVCKQLCCCGKNSSTSCSRENHCCKKCPSLKPNEDGGPQSDRSDDEKCPTEDLKVSKVDPLSPDEDGDLVFPDFSVGTDNQPMFNISVAEVESNRQEFASTSFSDIDVDLVDLDNLP